MRRAPHLRPGRGETPPASTARAVALGREGLATRLEAGARALGAVLTPAQAAQMLDYLALLGRWGRVYNLTAVREPGQMLTQHLLDSLAVWPALQRWLDARAGAPAQGTAADRPGAHARAWAPVDGPARPSLRLLDVGSGAGLPGAVLSIVAPHWQVTCVDAVGKKAGFVRQVAAELGLANLHAEHARVEAMPVPASGTGFDVVTSRAFASLRDFVQASEPQLAPGGVWMAMKGQLPEEEMAALPVQAEVFHVEQLAVPGLEARRCLIWMRRRG